MDPKLEQQLQPMHGQREAMHYPIWTREELEGADDGRTREPKSVHTCEALGLWQLVHIKVYIYAPFPPRGDWGAS